MPVPPAGEGLADGLAPSSASPATGPPVVSSQDLLAGGRELVIRHGADRYRLMLTGQNKLILTK